LEFVEYTTKPSQHQKSNKTLMPQEEGSESKYFKTS